MPDLGLDKALIIARREYLTLVRSRAFLIGLVLGPALMALTALLIPEPGAAVDAGPRRVLLLDQTGRLQAQLERAALELGLELESADSAALGPEALAEPEARVQSGELAAVLSVGARALDAAAEGSDAAVVLVVRNLAGDVARSLENLARDAIGFLRLRAAGIDEQRARALLGGVSIQMRTPRADAEDSMRTLLASLLAPLFTLLLVFLAVMSSAPYTLHSVIEEKQQRIAEVLLGSMSPFQLMAGKLLGTAAAGLTVVLVYAALAAFGAQRHGLGGVLSAGVIALSVADAAIALGLFGSIFLAMGAASSELKDAQGWMTPVMVVLMLPLLAISHLLHSPDGALAVGLSLFPLTAPLILPIRISLGSMPAWQIALSVCGTLAFTLLSIWAAGRVFRIGILAQGRAPRLGELYRWIRHG